MRALKVKSMLMQCTLSCFVLLMFIFGHLQQVAMASETRALSCEKALDSTQQLTKLQSMLIQVGLYHINKAFREDIAQYQKDEQELTDGFIGKVTKEWLGNFCQKLPDTQKSNVIESLYLYSALKKIEPDCKAIGNTSLLKEWFAERKVGVEKDWIKSFLEQCDPEFIPSEGIINNSIDEVDTNPSHYLLTEVDWSLIKEDTVLLEKLTTYIENYLDSDKSLEEVKEILSTMKHKAFPSENLFLKALYATLRNKQAITATIEGKLEITTENKKPEVITKEQQYDNTFKKISTLARKSSVIMGPILNDADCGCLKTIEEKMITYNIYPGWLSPFIDNEKNAADANELVTKSIDYSIISRIGFQGSSVNGYGRFNSNSNSNNDLKAWHRESNEFIEQAHKHYTKADIIIELEGWTFWEDKTINKSYENIKLKVLEKLNELDGITLYFPEYLSKDNLQLSNIAQKFLRLKKEYPDIKVNILLDVDICGDERNCTESASSKPLLDLKICEIAIDRDFDTNDEENQLCKLPDSEQAVLDYVLIFLPEETSYTKKHLRKVIEETYKGKARSVMLKKIIPIIMPYEYIKNDKLGQFEDDLIYAKYNFGGVGFWPLPLKEDASFDDLQKKINKHLFDNASQNKIEHFVKSVLSTKVCDLICTQPWYLKIFFYAFVVFLVASVFLKSASCYACKIIDQHYRIYLAIWAVTVLFFVSMLGCDYYLQERADQVMLGVFAFVVLMGFANQIVNIKKKQLP